MRLCKAAVGAEHLSGYEGRPIRCQKLDRGSNILGSAEPAEGSSLGEHIKGLLPEHLHHIGVYNARCDAVYADMRRRKLLRKRPREPDDGVLCR